MTDTAPTRQATDWTGAACIGEDPDAWFPEHGGPQLTAKRICGACPLIRECLTFALTQPDTIGIWGGTNERERRKHYRKWKPGQDPLDHAPHGTLPALRAHTDRGEKPCDKCSHALSPAWARDEAASLARLDAFLAQLEAANVL